MKVKINGKELQEPVRKLEIKNEVSDAAAWCVVALAILAVWRILTW